MCISKIKTFCDNKNSMDNTELNIGRPLRIKRICSEEQSGHPVKNKRFLKQFFK